MAKTITESNNYFYLYGFIKFFALSESSSPESLIIYGDAATLKVIGEIAWLAEKTIYLWADIAIKNFQILANLRQSFPKIQAFLLDKITFDKHQNVATLSTKESMTMIPGLTQEEQQFLLYLNNLEDKNTLLQKYISHAFLKKKLKQLQV